MTELTVLCINLRVCVCERFMAASYPVSILYENIAYGYGSHALHENILSVD